MASTRAVAPADEANLECLNCGYPADFMCGGQACGGDEPYCYSCSARCGVCGRGPYCIFGCALPPNHTCVPPRPPPAPVRAGYDEHECEEFGCEELTTRECWGCHRPRCGWHLYGCNRCAGDFCWECWPYAKHGCAEAGEMVDLAVPDALIIEGPQGVGSTQTIGGAEQIHDLTADFVRTLLSAIQRFTGLVVEPGHRLFCWAVRHAAYLPRCLLRHTCAIEFVTQPAILPFLPARIRTGSPWTTVS